MKDFGSSRQEKYSLNPEQYGFSNVVNIIPAFSGNYKDILVPKRFQEHVLSHVVALYLDNNHFFKPPLFLAIEGEPGEGKTSQSIATCVQKGINVIYISATDLSGSCEGDSKKVLEDVYSKALGYRKAGHLFCIIIDDFHKGIATEDENTRKTINSNLLTGYMMNMAENTGNIKIPIILTANSFDATYTPLLRFGRTNYYKWQPLLDEKKQIVRNILDPLIDVDDNLGFDGFFNAYKEESIAFFSQLKNTYRIKLLGEIVCDIEKIDDTSLQSINNRICDSLTQTSIKELIELAEVQKKDRSKQNV